MDTLLLDIESFMGRHALSEWSFGQLALNDRHLVRQLRDGRELRRATAERVRRFMATYRPDATAAQEAA